MTIQQTAPAAARATFANYLAIARPDHMTKQVFVIPGIALAALLRGVQQPDVALNIVLGFACAIFIASANYTINEWLDRQFDALHPTKSLRTAVIVGLNPRLVFLQWVILLALGLGCALLANTTMFVVALIFAAQGVVYNVEPMRSKDKAYLDVISESINNPLRLIIGWAMIDPATLPPSSIILAYWMGGAFLMAAKRLSEYREIVASHGAGLLARYRASFGGYSEKKLVVSCLTYALLSAFFLAVFLVKYRIEYILMFPVITALFGYYLALSMEPGSTAQKPEQLFREKGLGLIVGLLAATFAATTLYDLPSLDALTDQQYVMVPW